MNDTPPPIVHHRTEYAEGLRDPRVDIFVAERPWGAFTQFVSNATGTRKTCPLLPSDRADERSRGDPRGRCIIKKKKEA